MKLQRPPTLAFWILEAVVPVSQREALLGDLLEEFALQQETASPATASQWFWSQTWRSLPFLMWSALRTEWLHNMCVAAGVYALMAMLKVGAGVVTTNLAFNTAMKVIVGPIIFLAITATGGYITARIRERATVLVALMVFVTVVVLIRLNSCSVPVPWWYRFGFLTAGPLSVLIVPSAFRLHRPVIGSSSN